MPFGSVVRETLVSRPDGIPGLASPDSGWNAHLPIYE